MYVATWTGGSVVVVDANGTLSATIDTPSSVDPSWGPEAVAFDPVTKRVFSVETNGDVTVIDSSTNKVVGKVVLSQGGAWPMSASIVVDSTMRRVVASERFSPDKLAALDADTLKETATYPKSQADLGLAVNETTHMVYTGFAAQAFITGIDLRTGNVRTVVSGLPDGPSNFATDARTNRLYAAAFSAGLLYVIDASSNTLVDTIDVPAPGGFTNFLALNPADDRLYYSAAGSLVSIDVKTDSIVSERAQGTVAGMTFDSTRQRLYVLGYDGFLTALDVKHIDDLPSALPLTGGPPVSAGRGAWPELSGLALIGVAALMIRMTLALRKPMP